MNLESAQTRATTRIMVAGFQHETNTFSRTPAGYEEFRHGGGFPPLRRGDAVRELATVNLAIGGFLAADWPADVELLPVIWAAACPSGRVTADAFERIAGEIVDGACDLAPDAVLLDLHGAMSTDAHDDAEGELLARLRAALGPDVPIVATLDLHANVTARMLSHLDAAVGLRTYPHVDMARTGERAVALMRRLLAGERLHLRWRRVPFLIPVISGCTDFGVARDVLRMLEDVDEDRTCATFAAGFPATDFPECGPAVWAYSVDEDEAERAVDALHTAILAREPEWRVRTLTTDQAMARAVDAIPRASGRPIVIADAQDNPGQGGDARTTGLLTALVDAGVPGAVASFWDPAASAAAHTAGVGAVLQLSVGGHPGIVGAEPFEGRFEVEHLGEGRYVLEGPMMRGTAGDAGPTACLRIGPVRIVVTTHKVQSIDRAQLRAFGIDASAEPILVLKSSVHFRADFSENAAEIIVAAAPGPIPADPADLRWSRLPAETRTAPRPAGAIA